MRVIDKLNRVVDYLMDLKNVLAAAVGIFVFFFSLAFTMFSVVASPFLLLGLPLKALAGGALGAGIGAGIVHTYLLMIGR